LNALDLAPSSHSIPSPGGQKIAYYVGRFRNLEAGFDISENFEIAFQNGRLGVSAMWLATGNTVADVGKSALFNAPG
jgi:hypothetical protein